MYKRNCPQCHKELIHSSEKNCNRAIKANRACRTCSKRKHDIDLFKNLNRNCPNCDNIIVYSRFSDKRVAINNKSLCKKCSINGGKFKKEHKLNDIYNNSENNLSKLLEETFLSFYWLGFIIADGSLNKNKFELCLAKKDLNHLQKFAKFINFNKEIKFRNKSQSYRISFSNRISIPEIQGKYNLKDRKTYNPINFKRISKYNTELLLCLIIGIIDGDGCISKNGSKNSNRISIVSHKNWKKFYIKILKKTKLYNDFFIKGVKKTNIITINLYRRNKILLLKDIISKFNLPCLERKWNKISTNL